MVEDIAASYRVLRKMASVVVGGVGSEPAVKVRDLQLAFGATCCSVLW